jgi:hypothetical protein
MAALLCYWEEFSGGREQEEKEERGIEEGVVALEKDSRTSPRPSAASRRWHAGGPAQDTQELASWGGRRKKPNFAENPLGFGRFQEKK